MVPHYNNNNMAILNKDPDYKRVSSSPRCHAIVVSTAYPRWRSQQQEGGETVTCPGRVEIHCIRYLQN